MNQEKANGRVGREAMWQIIEIYGIGANILAGITGFYEQGNMCVVVSGNTSSLLSLNNELRQECGLFPWQLACLFF